jgi:hypothetical protein
VAVGILLVSLYMAIVTAVILVYLLVGLDRNSETYPPLSFAPNSLPSDEPSAPPPPPRPTPKAATTSTTTPPSGDEIDCAEIRAIEFQADGGIVLIGCKLVTK